jgi:trans-aconitate 2-methyltransferase
LKSHVQAQLRLVPDGQRKSPETVLEEPAIPRGRHARTEDFRDPYLHLTPEQYAQTAERNGFRIQHSHTAAKSWDFHTRANFFAFGQVTFVEWTRVLPEYEKPAIITDVLDRYQKVAADTPVEAKHLQVLRDGHHPHSIRLAAGLPLALT